MITKETMIPVPAQVVQNLIWNIELNFAGSENASMAIQTAIKQCAEIQKYLDVLHDDDESEFVLENFDNVVFANFDVNQ